jgi:hypothetical protein
MGADGGIAIYDWDGFVKSSNPNKKFIEELISSTVYIQTLNNRRYLTVYRGDNLCVDHNLLEALSWAKDGYKGEYLRDTYTHTELQEFESLRQKLETHRITYWELWT